MGAQRIRLTGERGGLEQPFKCIVPRLIREAGSRCHRKASSKGQIQTVAERCGSIGHLVKSASCTEQLTTEVPTGSDSTPMD